MKKTTVFSVLLLVMLAVSPSVTISDTSLEKEIELTGSFSTSVLKSAVSFFPIRAWIGAAQLHVMYLQDQASINTIIYSQTGNMVYSQNNNAQTGNQEYIDVSGWEEGMYEIRFINSQGLFLFGKFEITKLD